MNTQANFALLKLILFFSGVPKLPLIPKVSTSPKIKDYQYEMINCYQPQIL